MASLRLLFVLTTCCPSSDDPFALTPGYRACFKHRSFVTAKRGLVESLQGRGGITILTGAPGTGKTTLINDLVSRLGPTEVALGRVVTTQLRAPELLRAVAFSFGLDGTQPQPAVLHRLLQHYWAKQLRMRRRIILIVDEAQALQACAARLLGRLANGDGADRRVLHLILAGDANRGVSTSPSPFEDLAALATGRCHLDPLCVAEIGGYVRHRLDNCGWSQVPYITEQALTLVYHHTGGIPARINLFCRRLLLRGSVERKRRLHTDDVYEVLGELEAESLLPQPLEARS